MVAKKCIIIMMATILMSWTSFALTEIVDGITWTYTVENGCASVGGGSSSSPAIPKSTSGAITIPSNLGGYAVTNIGSYAFYGCSGLTSVTMHSGVASIGDGAYCGCSGLTSITIPDSVTSIGAGAFSGCIGLVEIQLPNSVKRIGADSFYGCSGLLSVTLGSGVSSIGDRAFSNCANLKTFFVDSHNSKYKVDSGLLLTYDGSVLVAAPGSLTQIALPEDVRGIGACAFCGCRALRILGKRLFRGAFQLTTYQCLQNYYTMAMLGLHPTGSQFQDFAIQQSIHLMIRMVKWCIITTEVLK